MKKSFDKLLNRQLLHLHDPLALISPDGTVFEVTVDDSGNLIVTGSINFTQILQEDSSFIFQEDNTSRVSQEL